MRLDASADLEARDALTDRVRKAIAKSGGLLSELLQDASHSQFVMTGMSQTTLAAFHSLLETKNSVMQWNQATQKFLLEDCYFALVESSLTTTAATTTANGGDENGTAVLQLHWR